MEKRMITTDVTEEDLPLEGSLRPQTLDEYIGQEKTKKTLKIYKRRYNNCRCSKQFYRKLQR